MLLPEKCEQEMRKEKESPQGNCHARIKMLTIILKVTLTRLDWNPKKASHYLPYPTKNLGHIEVLRKKLHYHLKELLRKSNAPVVVIGDSIEAGLRRYPTVWRNFILQYKTINLGIGGDRTANVLWRINDTGLRKSVRSVVILCGTNNIDTSDSDEISVGVITMLDVDPFSIATQISRSLLVAYYQETFIGLREE